jgi:hypothetical protein
MSKELIATIKVTYDSDNLPHVEAEVKCSDPALQKKLDSMYFSDSVILPIFNALKGIGKMKMDSKNYTE